MFARLVAQVSDGLHERVAELVGASEELKISDARILLSIAREQPCGVGQISRRTRIDKAWVSRSLRSLARRGLVRIEEGDGPPSKQIRLTSEGEACVGRLIPLLLDEWNRATRGIDVRLSLSMLQIVLDNLNEGRKTV